jgi:hypothetical protein
VGFVEVAFERIELPFPERAVFGDPGRGPFERAGREPQFMHATSAYACDQSGPLEHSQVP